MLKSKFYVSAVALDLASIPAYFVGDTTPILSAPFALLSLTFLLLMI
jgi:hypothetical protein